MSTATCPAAVCVTVTPSPVKSIFITTDTPESAEVRKLGDAAINRLAVMMVREVNSALAAAHGEPERAVDVLHLRDLPMTNGTVAGLPRITTLKRTSLRLRSPANAPDAADQLALEEVLRQLESGDAAPSVLVQRAEIPPAAPEWRVYKPIGIMPKCLACHGDPSEQSETLHATLRHYYPDDKASGYTAGAWRGVLRVTVAEAQAPVAPAKK
jgi:hypothetical protein